MSPAPEEPPLTPAERRRLRRRQRWMTVSLAAGALLLVASVVWPFGPQSHFWVWLGGIGLVVVSAALQFSRRCPRCSTVIGFQSRLALPPACRRCGVALRD